MLKLETKKTGAGNVKENEDGSSWTRENGSWNVEKGQCWKRKNTPNVSKAIALFVADIPQTDLALRGYYLCCAQLALIIAFRIGLRLSRQSGYLIRTAIVIKPVFCCVSGRQAQ